MNKLKTALLIAKLAHNGQVDKAGVDYMNHVYTVINGVKKKKEKIVAALHDVVEDTFVTTDDLKNIFSKKIIDAVDHITHRKNESYVDYIKRVKQNKIARKVKLADLTHNMDYSRLKIIREKDKEKLKLYKWAYDYILNKTCDIINSN